MISPPDGHDFEMALNLYFLLVFSQSLTEHSQKLAGVGNERLHKVYITKVEVL